MAFEVVSTLENWQMVDCWSWVWVNGAGCFIWVLLFGQEIYGKEGKGFSRQQLPVQAFLHVAAQEWAWRVLRWCQQSQPFAGRGAVSILESKSTVVLVTIGFLKPFSSRPCSSLAVVANSSSCVC